MIFNGYSFDKMVKTRSFTLFFSPNGKLICRLIEPLSLILLLNLLVYFLLNPATISFCLLLSAMASKHYIKEFARDFSIIMEEAWYNALSKGLWQKLDIGAKE